MGEATFLFADLSGFTALTEAHGDEQAAEQAAGFIAAARALIEEYGAEEVKTIGDAIMARCGDAESAVRLGLRLAHRVGSTPGSPAIRVGMHTGPAIERGGDYFGRTVNVAARVSGAAAGGEVLLSEATKAAIGEPRDIEFHQRGRRTLKNLSEPVTIYSALCDDARDLEGLAIDPVCRMAVDPESEAGRLVHGDRSYHFCSLECVRAFASDPQRYAAAVRPMNELPE